MTEQQRTYALGGLIQHTLRSIVETELPEETVTQVMSELEPEVKKGTLRALKGGLSDAFGGSSLAEIVEKAMSQVAPELMAKFYPRIYESTGRYHSPKQCAAFLVNSIVEAGRLGFNKAPVAYRIMMPGLEPMAKRGMPMFFLAPDLMEAVLRTDFTEPIDWTTLPLPYEQGIFVLPKGAFSHPKDGDVSMLMWLRLEPDTNYPMPFLPGMPITTVQNASLGLLALCPENALWYDSVLNARNRPSIRLRNIFYREPGDPIPSFEKHSFMDEDLAPEDEEFVEKMGTIMFGTWLVMNARPELVERGKLLRRVVKSDKVREFWSPNIVGPRYKLKREVPRIVDGKFQTAPRGATGTHASPRMHWRRGHTRQQPYGPERKERKGIWIEPMLVNADQR